MDLSSLVGGSGGTCVKQWVSVLQLMTRLYIANDRQSIKSQLCLDWSTTPAKMDFQKIFQIVILFLEIYAQCLVFATPVPVEDLKLESPPPRRKNVNSNVKWVPLPKPPNFGKSFAKINAKIDQELEDQPLRPLALTKSSKNPEAAASDDQDFPQFPGPNPPPQIIASNSSNFAPSTPFLYDYLDGSSDMKLLDPPAFLPQGPEELQVEPEDAGGLISHKKIGKTQSQQVPGPGLNSKKGVKPKLPGKSPGDSDSELQIDAAGLSENPNKGEGPLGKPYAFEYAVKDETSKTDYSHKAESNGEIVNGEYRILMADGRTQIVTYTAHWKNGFRPRIKYIPAPN